MLFIDNFFFTAAILEHDNLFKKNRQITLPHSDFSITTELKCLSKLTKAFYVFLPAALLVTVQSLHVNSAKQQQEM